MACVMFPLDAVCWFGVYGLLEYTWIKKFPPRFVLLAMMMIGIRTQGSPM